MPQDIGINYVSNFKHSNNPNCEKALVKVYYSEGIEGGTQIYLDNFAWMYLLNAFIFSLWSRPPN